MRERHTPVVGRKGIDFRLIQIVKEPPHAFFGTMQQQYAGRGGDESEAAKRLVAREKSKFDVSCGGYLFSVNAPAAGADAALSLGGEQIWYVIGGRLWQKE